MIKCKTEPRRPNLLQTIRFAHALRGIAVVAAVLLATSHAYAQTSTVPNALQGFSQNKGQPIQIDALSLEVRDKDKAATFSGNVKVVQGDTTMRAKSLVVFYDQDKSQDGKQDGKTDNKAALKTAAPGPTGSSSVRRLEAKGGVTVTQKDQTVTGETAVFEMKTNTVTMSGNVILTKDKNVLKGDRLVVDLTTGVSRVEGNRGVSGLFSSSAPSGASPINSLIPGSSSPPTNTPAAQPAAPKAAGKPLKLNSLQNTPSPRG